MRIVSGQYKGITFSPPAKLPARPTTDRTKEAIFNILQSQMQLSGCKALDLFSGTGNMAYEMASHEAESITCVEKHPASAAFIKSTFERLGYKPYRVLRTDALKFIETNRDKYDLIFCDPPYDLKEMSSLPERIFRSDLISDEGILIIEHRNTFNFDSDTVFKTREYGQSRFTFFKKLQEK
ncbi:MAG: RsmD family RNA methyltransferase [Flavobacteriales bacterium]|nr:RsmD family RNA methyltransferase [Flavobacteriales bacterium]